MVGVVNEVWLAGVCSLTDLAVFPSAVTLTCKCRKVTVTGPRGTLTKSFKHMDLELTRVGKKRIRVDIWFANRKQMACLRTICSHIENMFKGVLYVSLVYTVCCVCSLVSSM